MNTTDTVMAVTTLVKMLCIKSWVVSPKYCPTNSAAMMTAPRRKSFFCMFGVGV